MPSTRLQQRIEQMNDVLVQRPVLSLDAATSEYHDQIIPVFEPNRDGVPRHTHDRFYKFMTVSTTKRAPHSTVRVVALRHNGVPVPRFSPTPLRWHGTEDAEKLLVGSDRVLVLSRRPTEVTSWDLESPDRSRAIGQAFQFRAGDYEMDLIATSNDTLQETRLTATLHVGDRDITDVSLSLEAACQDTR